MDEKKETGLNSESSVSKEISSELLNFKKICNSRCNICNSGILKEIHDWRKNGSNFDFIVDQARDIHSVQISTASLSRHFKSYRAFKLEMATKIIQTDVIAEITSQSVHIRKTVELLDLAYEKIKQRINANTLNIDIGDLEKLAKMRYQILNGENPDDSDLTAIFQKATNEYGLDVQQGILFKK